MNAPNPQKTSLKQKAAHEFREIATLFLYLAFFFCALATYSMLLFGRFHISYFAYGAALINALVITKVILIGEAVHVGNKFEQQTAVLFRDLQGLSCTACLYSLSIFWKK